MSANNIYIGSMTSPSFFFTNDQLIDVSASTSVDAIGNEIKIDTLNFKVYYDDSNGDLRALTYSTPIWYYNGENFVGKFYFKNIERVGAKYYVIDAVSVIGLLEYEQHYGGMFTSKNVKDAIVEALTTDGVRERDPRMTFYEFGSSDWAATNIPLGANNRGNNSQDSGCNTCLYIKFRMNMRPADWSVATFNIWYTSVVIPIDSQSDTYRKFLYGVVADKISSNVASVLVYCSFEDDVSTQVFRISSLRVYDLIEIAFYPGLGKAYYRVNGGESTEITFSAITNYDYILPLYTLRGVNTDWNSTSHVPTADQLVSGGGINYSLYRLCFFSHDSNLAPSVDIPPDDEIYFDSQICKDDQDNSYFHDKIQNNFFSTYYSCGGNITGDNYTVLDRLANSIQWQSGVESLIFSGWIPSGTKRNTLHQILFALNLNLYKTESGDVVIGRLPSVISKEIGDDEIYESGSTEEVKKPKQISLTENSYTAPPESADAEVVFDNSAITTPSGQYIAEFNNAPIYGTPTGNGITIIRYNANAALVTGKGTISAKTYAKSTRVITEIISSRPDGDTVSVSDATLVTFLTSKSVMGKLKAYYANQAYKIKNSIVGNRELVGRKYTLRTPFGEQDDGYLISADIIGSGVTKINCEFVAGYTPVDIGQTYSNVAVLTGSGTWSVPSGVDKIRVVLIGGGNGGDSGYAGESGSPGVQSASYFSTQSNEGGMYGNNGESGLIYEIDIDNPSGSYSYSCGSGGSGGSICYSHDTNNQGISGGATTFSKSGTTYSSNSGEHYPNGYTDLLSGNTYAAPMPQWDEDSGKGGASGWHHTDQYEEGGYIYNKGVTYYAPESAYNKMTGNTFSGGGILSGFPAWTEWQYNVKDTRTYASGDGGGAALNQNGSSGSAARDNNTNSRGGNGANATYTPPIPTAYNPTNYGSGGMGGCGGGAGGDGGTRYMNWDGYDRWSDTTPGTGGYGGRGGQGGDGCILVYY